MDLRPVGIFDSGLGGLTAVRELRRLLPAEDIDPAWRTDLYQEIGDGLALFAGYETDW